MFYCEFNQISTTCFAAKCVKLIRIQIIQIHLRGTFEGATLTLFYFLWAISCIKRHKWISSHAFQAGLVYIIRFHVSAKYHHFTILFYGFLSYVQKKCFVSSSHLKTLDQFIMSRGWCLCQIGINSFHLFLKYCVGPSVCGQPENTLPPAMEGVKY